MKIWAHTLICNEERYIWYSVMSVIDYVDKILIWDTGSNDKTVEIVKEIKRSYPKRIEFEEIGKVTSEGFTKARQLMLEKTKSDWFMILDGDEVWWESSIKQLIDVIRRNEGGKLESIVSRYSNIIGDIYHYQEEAAGKYKIDEKVGHLTIRAMNRKISGLHFSKPHGQQGIFDADKKLIQERDKDKRIFIEELAYLHFTHMPRSQTRKGDFGVIKRKMKLKYEIGERFPFDFYYPEVFFRSKPTIVPSPWGRRSSGYQARSFFIKPLRFIKKFMPSGSGY